MHRPRATRAGQFAGHRATKPARMRFRWQKRWMLLAATCVVVVASVVFHRGVDTPPAALLQVAATGEGGAPTRATPVDVALPSAIPEWPRDVRATDDRSGPRRTLALTRAKLRRAQRQARLRARRHGTSAPMLLDADGSAVPL